ncbi:MULTISPECIES: TrmH family RNA methyltransferase [Mycobacteroides]|uniref:RNA methyltransferase n=1 Tax=Mycobacteroides chelonae TaxID=1774 RepID=A0A1S1LIZ0_MYCCH|nr:MULTISPECIES: RNA methyltransferase [Mycobacteroides]KRQ21045.1 RNA methyltransferase [Mycobacteroides sp. H003]KRQ35467.1 RNA methyltransferase [Mycobacteroides sp. H092]KRQ37256.1 RNA methyltransferase [Mycobacteroides sp. H101]KRQ43866.1 RNA methyltransferase [Mycobacteroides sp. H063]KRQ61258.1 RNA methyltransferase [Mycobacteroides sp. H079]
MIDAVKLHRPAARRRAGLFLAEGPNLVEAALRSGAVERVFATEAATERFAGLLVDAPVRLVTERAAKALSDTVTPVGLVAECRSIAAQWSQIAADSPRFVVVAVDVSEPGNAGTLIRVADAMGADAVVLAGNSVDPFNGKSLRASAGSVFNVPVVPAGDAAVVAENFTARGGAVLATTLDGELSLDDADPVLAGPCAWIFGNEAHGLDSATAALATHRINIPMRGGAESLNLASAASICLYATARMHRGR